MKYFTFIYFNIVKSWVYVCKIRGFRVVRVGKASSIIVESFPSLGRLTRERARRSGSCSGKSHCGYYDSGNDEQLGNWISSKMYCNNFMSIVRSLKWKNEKGIKELVSGLDVYEKGEKRTRSAA